MALTKLSELPAGEKRHAALARQVLAVLSRRADGWAVYLGAVAGEDHDAEWPEVAAQGSKQLEPIARAIVEQRFGYEIDLPYVT